MRTKTKCKWILCILNIKPRPIYKLIIIWEWWIKWEIFHFKQLSSLSRSIPSWDHNSKWCKCNLSKWWHKCHSKLICHPQCNWWHKSHLNNLMICNISNQKRTSTRELFLKILLILNKIQDFKEEEVWDP